MLEYLFRVKLPEKGGAIDILVKLDQAVLLPPDDGYLYRWSVSVELASVDSNWLRQHLASILLPVIGGQDSTAHGCATSAMNVFSQQLLLVARVVNIDYQAAPFEFTTPDGRLLLHDIVGAMQQQLGPMQALLPQCECRLDTLPELSRGRSDSVPDPNAANNREGLRATVRFHSDKPSGQPSVCHETNSIWAILREVEVTMAYLGDLQSRIMEMLPATERPRPTTNGNTTTHLPSDYRDCKP